MKSINQIIQEEIEKFSCEDIDITPEIRDEVLKYNSSEELLRGGGISIEALDRAAHGFAESDVKELMPNQLHIKWFDDLKDVKWEIEKKGISNLEYAQSIDLSEPIDVSYERGRGRTPKFYIEDGHHRYYAAKILKKPLKVNLDIKVNPMKKLAGNMGYDQFHRCLFDQVKREQ